jgi:mono/diheme cytochrome c family protein
MRATRQAVQLLLLAGLASCTSADAATKAVTLPADGVQLEASKLPGYLKAQANCMTCHSAEYIRYQPPSAPRAYWEAMVKRMKAVFNAPINDAEMPDIVDYLVRTYGAERTQTSGERRP